MMLVYRDWRALWPGVLAIIVQHTVFSYLHNTGHGVHFFEPARVSLFKLTFHLGIALLHAAVASHWARALRRQALREAAHRRGLERANAELTANQAELEVANAELHARTLELELQAEEMQAGADALAERTAAVEAAGARYQSLVRAVSQIVWSMAPDGRMEDAPEWRAYTGQSIEAARGWGWLDAIHPDDQRRVAATWAAAVAVLGDYDTTYRARGADGRDRWFAVRGVPVLERDGATIREWVGVCTDIDERKRAEDERAALLTLERAARGEAEQARAEAEAANAAKSQFLATMSHELRTPLNAISGYAELLSMGLRGPVTDAQLEDLRRIRRSGQHLLSLINDVLNFARLEAGRVDLHVGDVAAAEVVAGAEALVGPQMRAKGILVEWGGCDPALRVRADAEKVSQILLNLLTNAIKFTAPGGRVTLGCDADGERVVVRVADTGRGIPADQIGRIFEPFVQVDRHLTRDSQQGVGLGLAISRDLARAMEGDLTVESTVGVGSRFTLVLPRADAAQAAPVPAPGWGGPATMPAGPALV
jgi:PAS domain S-box-containing protein